MSEKPNGIECVDWTPAAAGSKRCAHYADGGGCKFHADGVCSEWTRVNLGKEAKRYAPTSQGRDLPSSSPATPPPTGARPLPEDPHAPAPLRLVPTPAAPAEESAAQRARRLFELAKGNGPRGAVPAAVVEAPPYVPAKAIDRKEVEELEAIAQEVVLESAELGKIYLVRRHTPDATRLELTFSEAATLRLIVDAFPGARVVGLVLGADDEVPF